MLVPGASTGIDQDQLPLSGKVPLIPMSRQISEAAGCLPCFAWQASLRLGGCRAAHQTHFLESALVQPPDSARYGFNTGITLTEKPFRFSFQAYLPTGHSVNGISIDPPPMGIVRACPALLSIKFFIELHRLRIYLRVLDCSAMIYYKSGHQRGRWGSCFVCDRKMFHHLVPRTGPTMVR